MKVKELINELETFDKKLPVYVEGHEITSIDVGSIHIGAGEFKTAVDINIKNNYITKEEGDAYIG